MIPPIRHATSVDHDQNLKPSISSGTSGPPVVGFPLYSSLFFLSIVVLYFMIRAYLYLCPWSQALDGVETRVSGGNGGGGSARPHDKPSRIWSVMRMIGDIGDGIAPSHETDAGDLHIMMHVEDILVDEARLPDVERVELIFAGTP